MWGNSFGGYYAYSSEGLGDFEGCQIIRPGNPGDTLLSIDTLYKQSQLCFKYFARAFKSSDRGTDDIRSQFFFDKTQDGYYLIRARFQDGYLKVFNKGKNEIGKGSDIIALTEPGDKSSATKFKMEKVDDNGGYGMIAYDSSGKLVGSVSIYKSKSASGDDYGGLCLSKGKDAKKEGGNYHFYCSQVQYKREKVNLDDSKEYYLRYYLNHSKLEPGKSMDKYVFGGYIRKESKNKIRSTTDTPKSSKDDSNFRFKLTKNSDGSYAMEGLSLSTKEGDVGYVIKHGSGSGNFSVDYMKCSGYNYFTFPDLKSPIDMSVICVMSNSDGKSTGYFGVTNSYNRYDKCGDSSQGDCNWVKSSEGNIFRFCLEEAPSGPGPDPPTPPKPSDDLKPQKVDTSKVFELNLDGTNSLAMGTLPPQFPERILRKTQNSESWVSRSFFVEKVSTWSGNSYYLRTLDGSMKYLSGVSSGKGGASRYASLSLNKDSTFEFRAKKSSDPSRYLFMNCGEAYNPMKLDDSGAMESLPGNSPTGVSVKSTVDLLNSPRNDLEGKSFSLKNLSSPMGYFYYDPQSNKVMLDKSVKPAMGENYIFKFSKGVGNKYDLEVGGRSICVKVEDSEAYLTMCGIIDKTTMSGKVSVVELVKGGFALSFSGKRAFDYGWRAFDDTKTPSGQICANGNDHLAVDSPETEVRAESGYLFGLEETETEEYANLDGSKTYVIQTNSGKSYLTQDTSVKTPTDEDDPKNYSKRLSCRWKLDKSDDTQQFLISQYGDRAYISIPDKNSGKFSPTHSNLAAGRFKFGRKKGSKDPWKLYVYDSNDKLSGVGVADDGKLVSGSSNPLVVSFVEVNESDVYSDDLGIDLTKGDWFISNGQSRVKRFRDPEGNLVPGCDDPELVVLSPPQTDDEFASYYKVEFESKDKKKTYLAKIEGKYMRSNSSCSYGEKGNTMRQITLSDKKSGASPLKIRKFTDYDEGGAMSYFMCMTMDDKFRRKSVWRSIRKWPRNQSDKIDLLALSQWNNQTSGSDKFFISEVKSAKRYPEIENKYVFLSVLGGKLVWEMNSLRLYGDVAYTKKYNASNCKVRFAWKDSSVGGGYNIQVGDSLLKYKYMSTKNTFDAKFVTTKDDDSFSCDKGEVKFLSSTFVLEKKPKGGFSVSLHTYNNKETVMNKVRVVKYCDGEDIKEMDLFGVEDYTAYCDTKPSQPYPKFGKDVEFSIIDA